MDLEGRLSC